MSSDCTEAKRLKRFRGKTALITGAAGDLGSTTARLFGEEGARLVLFDLSNTEPKLKQLVPELLSLGSPAVIYVCGDVSKVEDVKKSVQRGVDECGDIDILFNCAGAVLPTTPMELTDEAAFKRIQDVNVNGVFLMMKYVSNQMIESGKEGVIVNVSSIAGIHAQGFGDSFAYCTSKFAVSGMTRAAAKSLAKHNIRVSAIAPGPLDGSMLDGFFDNLAETAMKGMGPGPQDKDAIIISIKTDLLKGNPLGRFAQMREAAEAVLFLCSKEASYITGAVLPVDGGTVA